MAEGKTYKTICKTKIQEFNSDTPNPNIMSDMPLWSWGNDYSFHMALSLRALVMMRGNVHVCQSLEFTQTKGRNAITV